MFDLVGISFYGWFLLTVIVFVLANLVASQRVKNWGENGYEETKCNENDGFVNRETNGPTQSDAEETALIAAKLEYARQYDDGDSSQSKTVSQLSIPVTRGPDAKSVEWINNSLRWLYSQCNASVLVESWLSALNARARKASAENDILVEFESIQTWSLPLLYDLYTTSESNDDVMTTCRVKSESLGFKILTTHKKGQNKNTVQYDLIIEKLNGKLRFFSNVEEVIFIVCFVDRPDIKLTLKPSDGSPKNSTHGQRSVEDAVVNIIINAIATATVDLHLEKHRNFPKCQHRKKEDSQKYSNLSILPYNSLSTRHEQRLLVKVIKANNLGSKKGCQEPFCVVEMDEPSQRFQTTVVKNTNNPFWDEHFLFNLKNSSAEILFEVYDRGKNSGATERFLGLGIIGVKELMNKPSQKLIIPLQSQPIGNDAVTGSLTVEFLFMDGAEVPVIGDTSEKPKELIESNSRITQGGTVITTTTFRASKGLEGSDETLVDTDLQNFDSKKKVESPSMIDDNTLIIHSIHGVKLDKNGRWREVSQAEEMIDSSATPPCSRLPKTDQTDIGESVSSSESEKDEVERGRLRDRRSFMGTLRKRLSLRKNRSRSVEQKVKTPTSISRESSRSLSVDRSKSISGSREASSTRSSAENPFLDVPRLGRDGNSSARSSISEDSDISASSTRTYIHENSTLVVETNENGVIKHYIIPGSLANRSKWRKRGIKLHIYNDHIFVAKHLSGSTVCEVCGKHLSRRPGKQGYECRDCNMLCHKSCHVRVESYCPHSTINTMDMEYVQDPRTRSKSS